jgi:hypothetical protein
MKTHLKSVAASLLFAVAGPALAATASWNFTLPATLAGSQTSTYAPVATLTLTDIADGVQFMLDPHESHSGFTLGSSPSAIRGIEFVYDGPALTSASFRHDAGAAIKAFDYESGGNMFAGYTAANRHISVEFFSQPSNDFEVTHTSTWTVKGTTLADFIGSFATADNKPTPVFSVLSLARFSLDGSGAWSQADSSKWVAPIPEPETYAMLLAGLGMLGFVGKRRSRARHDASMSAA